MHHHMAGEPEDSTYVRLAKRHMEEIDVEVSVEYTPGNEDYHNQPSIPYILFKPKAVNEALPAPLVIHTHGGPHVVFKDTTLHAEIIYLLSHGIVVACPNYRGSLSLESSPHPEEALWASWIDRSKGAHHLLGPEDVFAVTEEMMRKPYIDPQKILLRGGSAGSFVNAHLLAEINRGKFPSVYKGVLLAGGIKYPLPSEMPDDVPLFLAHAQNDPIAPFDIAELFAKGIASHPGNTHSAPLVLHLVERGGHHFIEPQTHISNRRDRSYREMEHYLRESMTFTLTCLGLPLGDLNDTTLVNERKPPSPASRLISSSVPEVTYLSSEQALSVTRTEPVSRIGPSMAYLGLILGHSATGNVCLDLKRFLLEHVNPIEWQSENREPLGHAGRTMFEAKGFFDQMVMNIEREQHYLSDNPEHMVLYHACNHSTLLLYTVISLWRNLLLGTLSTDMHHIDFTRLFSFDMSAFESIDVFLDRMRQRRTDSDYAFNNTSEFSPNAFSANLGLTFNEYNTASFTMWWFYALTTNTTHNSPYESIIEELLKALGIYSKARIARYLTLFDQLIQTATQKGINQNLLQQVFVHAKALDEGAYMCGMWGEEFKSNKFKLSKPSTLKKLESNPLAFEASLWREQSAFFVPSSLTPSQFGDDAEGFFYTGTLQARVLANTFNNGLTFSTVRDTGLFKQSVERIMALIREDYRDYILNNTKVPDALFGGASCNKNALRQRFGMPPAEEIQDAALIAIYTRFQKHLVENPHPYLYRDIWLDVSIEQKGRVQMWLHEHDLLLVRHLHLFSLCRYIKGYTYFDLLSMIIDAHYAKLLVEPDKSIERLMRDNAPMQLVLERDDITAGQREALKREMAYNTRGIDEMQKIKADVLANKDWFMSILHRYCLPKSMADSTGISSGLYHDFRMILRNAINRFERNQYEFEYIPPKENELANWFGAELDLVLAIATNYARIAKESDNGHDTRQARSQVY